MFRRQNGTAVLKGLSHFDPLTHWLAIAPLSRTQQGVPTIFSAEWKALLNDSSGDGYEECTLQTGYRFLLGDQGRYIPDLYDVYDPYEPMLRGSGRTYPV